MSRLTSLARNLRQNQTEAEQKLWFELRNRRFLGLKFRRQVAIEGYIADFMCVEQGVIIELDGGQHTEAEDHDRERSDVLESRGFIVKRYWNNDVLVNMDAVLADLKETLNPLTPTLSPWERED